MAKKFFLILSILIIVYVLINEKSIDNQLVEPQVNKYNSLKMQGKITKVINHEKVLWQSGNLSKEIYLIGIYVPKGMRSYVKEYLKSCLLGKEVGLELDIQPKDRFGNYYGYFYLKDQMINGLLIKKGYAFSAVVPPNNRYSNEFLKWELEARNSNKGIWKNKIIP